MSEPTRDQVERRAYELWQEAGFPNGRDKEFDCQAERELRNQECSTGTPATKKNTLKRISLRQRRFFDC